MNCKKEKLEQLRKLDLNTRQLRQLAEMFKSLNEKEIKDLIEDTQELKILEPGRGFRSTEAAIGIPEQWQEEMKKKVDTDITPQQLIKDRAKILDTTETKIQDPARFVRDLNHTLNYIGEMKDPKKRGLFDVLNEYLNKLLMLKRKGIKDIPFSSVIKKEILDKVINLEDSGKLIGLVADLFEGRHTRASIAGLLRRIAASIKQ